MSSFLFLIPEKRTRLSACLSGLQLGAEDGGAADDGVASVVGDDYADYLRLFRDLEEEDGAARMTSSSAVEALTFSTSSQGSLSAAAPALLFRAPSRRPLSIDPTHDRVARLQPDPKTGELNFSSSDRGLDPPIPEKHFQTSEMAEEHYSQTSASDNTRRYPFAKGAERSREEDVKAPSMCTGIILEATETTSEDFGDTGTCGVVGGSDISAGEAYKARRSEVPETELPRPPENGKTNSEGHRAGDAEGRAEAVSPSGQQKPRVSEERGLGRRGAETPVPQVTGKRAGGGGGRESGGGSKSGSESTFDAKTASLPMMNPDVWERQVEWARSGEACTTGVEMYADLTNHVNK